MSTAPINTADLIGQTLGQARRQYPDYDFVVYLPPASYPIKTIYDLNRIVVTCTGNVPPFQSSSEQDYIATIEQAYRYITDMLAIYGDDHFVIQTAHQG